MKRFSLFTALPTLLLIFGLAACASDSGTDADSETAEATGPAPEIVPGTYTIDASHSDVGFRARHLGISNVDGRFTDVEGTVTIGEELSSLYAEAEIQVGSVDTRNDDRDNHLRSPDFFDAEAHPTITFVSTGVEPLGGGRFRMDGDLTIRGVTQPISLEGEYLGSVTGMQGNQVVAFTSEGEINRMDYDVSWNNTLDSGGLIVGEDVGLTINIEAAGETTLEAPASSSAAPATSNNGAEADSDEGATGDDGVPMVDDGAEAAGCDGEPMGDDDAEAAGCDGEPMGDEDEAAGGDEEPVGSDV